MAHDIGFVDNTGSEGVAHWQMLLKIKTLAEANGWTTLRYLNPTPYTDNTVIRELILQGVGLSGTEQIFIGFRTYQNQSLDYYNLTCAGFTGYVSGNTFTAQPGYFERGVCAHNNRIDYWLAVNAQRIMFALRMSAPLSYEFGYAGKFFPYASPSEYPYPLLVMGMLTSPMPATRYSDTTGDHQTAVKGAQYNSGSPMYWNADSGRFLHPSMAWTPSKNSPWTRPQNAAPQAIRDSGGYYAPLPIEMMTRGVDQLGISDNVWGVLDGVRYVSGFNNQAENTGLIDGKSYVVMADAERNGIADYFLVEMD